MIQSNANAKFSIKYESLGLRVIKGPLTMALAVKALCAREVERPPFYSDIRIDEVFIIEKVSQSAIYGKIINGAVANGRVAN